MASKKTDRDIIGAAITRGLLPEDALDTPAARFVVAGGTTLHANDTCYTLTPRYGYQAFGSYNSSTKGKYPTEELTFTQMSDRGLTVCPQCVYVPRTFPKIGVALDLCEIDNIARLAERVKAGKLAPGSVERKLREISGSSWRLDQAEQSGFFADAVNSTRSRLEKASEHLKKISRDPAAREKVLDVARTSLCGRYPVTLDETPTVAGLVGAYFPKALEELRRGFSIREDSNVAVLLLPRYLYDYLQRELFRTNSAPSLLVAYPAGDLSDALLETAAVLWTPQDKTSPCSDLKSALEAAENLEAE